MTCDAYYENHPLPDSTLDKCAKREIEAGTARALSLLGASTTIFGLVNLLITGWSIKRFGVKATLLMQVFWPAVRLAVQNVGVTTGSTAGMWIFQASQIITVIGGPNGYLLALNSLVTDVVEHEARTSALGRLQGCTMIGYAFAVLLGGFLGEAFGILAPFRVTLALFLLCCLYVALALPSIMPEKNITAVSKKTGLSRFFGPLRILTPQRWTLPDGRTSLQFGALTLGIGVFLGILATGYIPTLLQLYSTDEFGFRTSANGALIFIYSTLRGLFLTLAFPRIISAGRKWLQSSESAQGKLAETETGSQAQDPPTSPNETDLMDSMDNETEPLHPPERSNKKETFAFDLLYARWSLLADGILTGLAVFVSKGWQLYLFAAVIPLAAGTGAASKGTILQMLPSSERVDALSGITLVENIARLSTIAVFGLIFAALAEVGKSYLVFVCNAGVALLGFCVLLLSRFPPEGSTRVDD